MAMLQKELTFACALANNKIRSSIGTYYDDLSWSSPLAQKVIAYFQLPDVNENIFNPLQFKCFAVNYAVEGEVDKLMEECIEFSQLGNNVQVFLNSFKQFYQTKFLSTLIQEHGDNADKLITGLERMRDINLSPIHVDRLGELDIETVIKEDLGDFSPVPTSFDFVRRATDVQGYMRGQLVMVVAPPGAGKSLFLANECVNFLRNGLKVYWMALGDMMRYDFISRLTSIASGVSFRSKPATARAELETQFRENKDLFTNLRFSVLSAGQIDIYTAKNFIETTVATDDDIDVVILDYDANLLSRNDSSYLEGELVYNAMSALARPPGRKYRLSMIASQPKIQYWDDQELDKDCAADSARKQAIVDMMITIGRNQREQRHMGVMKAAKVRRGQEGVKTYYTVTECGQFNEDVTADQYAIGQVFKGDQKEGRQKRKHYDANTSFKKKTDRE